MATSPLSPNWRQLQVLLKESPPLPSPNPLPPDTAGPNVGTQTLPAETPTPTSLALWAEENDIPQADVAMAYDPHLATGTTTFVPASASTEVGKYISLDCEMVGVGGKRRSALARVSVVNYHGNVILDTFVRPKEKVTDWRTWVSGVTPSCMESAREFEDVQSEVAELMRGKILVGHALTNDLGVLFLSHPRRDTRDTSRHQTFRKLNGGHTPALKMLAKKLLGLEIQGGEHSSVEDARACMLLYRGFRKEFEELHSTAYTPRPKAGPRAITRKKKHKKGKKKKGKKEP